MRQLDPRLGERELEFLRVLPESLGDDAVGRVELQREVGREHDRRMPLGGVVRVGHQVRRLAAGRHPLRGARGTLGAHPFVGKEIVEILRAPLRGRGSPGAFQAAGDRVGALPAAAGVLPSEPLLLQAGRGRLGSRAVRGVLRAVRLAERVASRNQGERLFVVHRHAAEGFADVPRGGQRIGVPVRTFGVHIDQAHLHRRQRLLQLPVAAVALIGEELPLRTPVDEIRLPVVRAPAGETEGLEAHRLQGDIAGQHHQVAPGELGTVLLLHRPQQPPRLVEIGVVGPAIQRIEALLPAIAAAAPVQHPVGAGAVPRHPDEERTVVAVVGRPPLLRSAEHLLDVLLHGPEVEGRKRLGIVEVLAERIGLGGVLPQGRQVEFLRPPELVALGLLGESCWGDQEYRGRGRQGRGQRLKMFSHALLLRRSMALAGRLRYPSEARARDRRAVFRVAPAACRASAGKVADAYTSLCRCRLTGFGSKASRTNASGGVEVESA